MASLVDAAAVEELRSAPPLLQLEKFAFFVKEVLDVWAPPERVQVAAKHTLNWLDGIGKAARRGDAGMFIPDELAVQLIAFVEWVEGEFRDLDGRIRKSAERN